MPALLDTILLHIEKQNKYNLSNIEEENSERRYFENFKVSQIYNGDLLATSSGTNRSVRSHAPPRAENEVAFTSLVIHFADVLAEERTQSATKKLPKWVSETGEETRSQPAAVRMDGIDSDLN